MGLIDRAVNRAKDAAEDLRRSLAGGGAREAEQLYRDLGMITYLATTGRPVDEADRQRLVNALGAIEQQGNLPAFRLLVPAPHVE